MLKKSTFWVSHSQCHFLCRYSSQNQKERDSSWCPVCLLPHPTEPALCCVPAWFTTSTLLQAIPACLQCKLNHQFKAGPTCLQCKLNHQSQPCLQCKLNHQSQPCLQCKLNHLSQPYMSSVQAEPPKPALHVFSASWTTKASHVFSASWTTKAGPTCLQCKLNHQNQPYVSSVQAEPPKPALRVFSASWTTKASHVFSASWTT